MAKTVAQRQADFRKLHGNAEKKGMTKAAFIRHLLHGNDKKLR